MTLKTGWVVFLNSGLSIAWSPRTSPHRTSPGRSANLPSVSPIWGPATSSSPIRTGKPNLSATQTALDVFEPDRGTSSETSSSGRIAGRSGIDRRDLRTPSKTNHSEFHSLSLHGTWRPATENHFWIIAEQPGIGFRPVRMLRSLRRTRPARARADARTDSRVIVRSGSSGQGQGELRMLTQPIYRYASPENDVIEERSMSFRGDRS